MFLCFFVIFNPFASPAMRCILIVEGMKFRFFFLEICLCIVFHNTVFHIFVLHEVSAYKRSVLNFMDT